MFRRNSRKQSAGCPGSYGPGLSDEQPILELKKGQRDYEVDQALTGSQHSDTVGTEYTRFVFDTTQTEIPRFWKRLLWSSAACTVSFLILRPVTCLQHGAMFCQDHHLRQSTTKYTGTSLIRYRNARRRASAAWRLIDAEPRRATLACECLGVPILTR